MTNDLQYRLITSANSPQRHRELICGRYRAVSHSRNHVAFLHAFPVGNTSRQDAGNLSTSQCAIGNRARCHADPRMNRPLTGNELLTATEIYAAYVGSTVGITTEIVTTMIEHL